MRFNKIVCRQIVSPILLIFSNLVAINEAFFTRKRREVRLSQKKDQVVRATYNKIQYNTIQYITIYLILGAVIHRKQ